MNEHVSQDAALYALGVLDERTAAAFERHAATCRPCAVSLGDAEADVAAIADSQPQHDAPHEAGERLRLTLARTARAHAWMVRAGALAAAFLVGLLPSYEAYRQNAAMRAAMVTQNEAVARLASEPHRTARFGRMSAATDARVMYARDGSWYVIVIRGTDRVLHVAWMHQGTETMLGSAVPAGKVAMLYLPRSHRMRSLALLDGGRTVAKAQLAY